MKLCNRSARVIGDAAILRSEIYDDAAPRFLDVIYLYSTVFTTIFVAVCRVRGMDANIFTRFQLVDKHGMLYVRVCSPPYTLKY